MWSLNKGSIYKKKFFFNYNMSLGNKKKIDMIIERSIGQDTWYSG